MSARELAARLAHDVGKYAARTARNIPRGAVPDALFEMLLKDLYAIDGRRPASVVFAELAEPLEQLAADARIDECRRLLAEIDGLERAVRERDRDALHRAAELALELDGRLRALARDLAEEGR